MKYRPMVTDSQGTFSQLEMRQTSKHFLLVSLCIELEFFSIYDFLTLCVFKLNTGLSVPTSCYIWLKASVGY